MQNIANFHYTQMNCERQCDQTEEPVIWVSDAHQNNKIMTKTPLTFSFMNCSTEKASTTLLSSPKALINEFNTKMLTSRPSAFIALTTFSAWSAKPCRLSVQEPWEPKMFWIRQIHLIWQNVSTLQSDLHTQLSKLSH